MSEVRWPVAELDQITRLRAVAAAFPSAGIADTVVDLPFEQAWSWLTDFEHSVPTFDTQVRKVRIRHRRGDRIHLWAWNRMMPVPLPVVVTIEPGFCIMQARLRSFLVLMAAEPTADGRTRYAHVEAVALPRFGRLRRVFQRMVDGDVRGVERTIGT